MNVAQMRAMDASHDELGKPRDLSPRILLADDDDDLRIYLARRLRRVGYEVLESPDGASVLDLIGSGLLAPRSSQSMPDLVALDVRMPGVSGLQVLCGLRNADLTLPILIMTAWQDPKVADEATRLGANGLLLKPFSAETFVRAVDCLIKGS